MDAFYIHNTTSGCVRIEGADRQQFFQRQVTNDVASLAPGRAVLAALTNPMARIIDLLYLLQPGEGESIFALSLAASPGGLARYLKNRIFFMDKISLSDISSEMAQLSLGGEAAGQALTPLGMPQLPAVNEVIEADGVFLLGQEPVLGLPYRLILPANRLEEFTNKLDQSGVTPLTSEEYEIYRVERGIPAGGHELTEEYTPLEVGLETAISDRKGCYTGQEVIARQITYDKVNRRLVGLKMAAPAQPGDKVNAEGKPAGEITSYSNSPLFGPIALAVLRKPYFEPGGKVTVISGDTAQAAQVTALPFKE